MANVTRIPAKKQQGNNISKVEHKKLRVAAYCRVSTEFEGQETSYEIQQQHYEMYIRQNPDWIFAGIYADSGISATSTKYREEFNRMISDCMEGKIDLILTKSISRFARNTVDCLKYIRMLKEKNIAVFFEKENINTMDSRGETMLTILASLAQQESESLSNNVKIGVQYRFQQGKVMVNCTHFLGYDKDENGKLVINPEQAEIVKRIFREYLEGKSCYKIALGLERDGIPPTRGGKKWHGTVIDKILRNEKYMGDALLQKTYTVDFLSKKRIKNNGALPQYYVEDDHEPIIPRETFMLVQEEIARRSSKRDKNGKKTGYSSNHCFSKIIYCAECGEIFRRVHWNNRGKKSIVWRCTSRLDKKSECHARTVNEELLKTAFLEAIHILQENKSDYLEVLKKNIETVLKSGKNEDSESIDERLEKLQAELIEKTKKHEDYTQTAEEILELKAKKEQFTMDDSSKKDYIRRIKDLQNFIKKQPVGMQDFDEKLVNHLLAKVTVFENHIDFEFKSGIIVEVEI